ncbi:hypothetical protein OSB04_021744 [Centaurea solstitialis]|uniref:Uncharacterized protein n=1 Tax=Centaurea solstitialis TaxID=347529 RepID=A0AA38WI15_9ASTR|nr:hypothetical protein OSB04_021744 [Centaurea solstitialis]
MRSTLPLFLSSSVVERSVVNRLVVGAGYHETKDLLSKEIRFGTIICPRFNIEKISEVFPDFVRNRSESNSNDLKHFFLHYFGNPRTQSYGYVKYRISNPSSKDFLKMM